MLKMEALRTVKEVQWLTKRLATLNCFVFRATNRCLPFFQILRKASKFKWILDYEKAFIQLKDYLSQPPLLSKP